MRQPISNNIIKIGYRTVHFSLILRAFSTCPFYGTKAKLLKTEEEKIDRSPYIDRSLSFFAFNNFIDICLKQRYHLFRHKSEKRNAYAEKTALQMD